MSDANSAMDERLKFRPSLTGRQIRMMLAGCRMLATDAEHGVDARAVIKVLAPLIAKMEMGVVNPAYVTRVALRDDINTISNDSSEGKTCPQREPHIPVVSAWVANEFTKHDEKMRKLLEDDSNDARELERLRSGEISPDNEMHWDAITIGLMFGIKHNLLTDAEKQIAITFGILIA